MSAANFCFPDTDWLLTAIAFHPSCFLFFCLLLVLLLLILDDDVEATAFRHIKAGCSHVGQVGAGIRFVLQSLL